MNISVLHQFILLLKAVITETWERGSSGDNEVILRSEMLSLQCQGI